MKEKILDFVKDWLDSNIEDELQPEVLKADSRDLKEKILEMENEKIHNRSKPRVRPAAGNHCSRIKDYEQQLDQTRSPDPDQWRQAASSKPKDTRIRPQAWAQKWQAASNKLDKA